MGTEWVEKKEDPKPEDPKLEEPKLEDPKLEVSKPDPVSLTKNDEYALIRSALEKYCGGDWKQFMENFEREEVIDTDLKNIHEDDLKELILKMGPRKRFWRWMQSMKQ